LVGWHDAIITGSYENETTPDEQQATFPNLSARYGLLSMLEVQAFFPSAIDSGSNGSGITDTAIGAKLGTGLGRSSEALAIVQTFESGTRRFSEASSTAATGSFAYALSHSVNIVPAYVVKWSHPLGGGGARSEEFQTQPSFSVEVDLPAGSEVELEYSQISAHGSENSQRPAFQLDLRHFLSDNLGLTFSAEWNSEEANTRSLEAGGAVFLGR
jgi:hypothetical protein